MILTKCPLRVSLIGGSTDLTHFVDKFGKGSVISFTPNLYTYVSIHDNNVGKYIINYSLKEQASNPIDIKNKIVKNCVNYFSIPPCTITFNTNILSSGSGLASSSSFIISMIKACVMYKKLDLSNKEINDLAFQIEKKINYLAGYQDVYGCGVGNFKRIDFRPTGQEVYKFLSFSFISKKYSMYLINTEITRRSTNILETIDVSKSYHLLDMVDRMEKAIIEKKEGEFFEIFNYGLKIKKTTSNEIINNKTLLNLEIYLFDSDLVKGLKLCGAGGGGYFLVFVEKQNEETFKQYFNKKYSNKPLINIEIENNGITGVRI